MKKAIVKGMVFGLTFFAAVLIISHIMNIGNHDMTVEMEPAHFPVVYMDLNGVRYNELHGYAKQMSTAYMRDTITALDEKRTTGFIIETYGNAVREIAYEVRSANGERLIEDTKVTAYEEKDGAISGQIALKDLIERDTEYELILILTTTEGDNIRYYTRVVWPEEYYLDEKLSFALSFHEKTFDKEAVKDLAKYMETNSEGDNTTLQKVDIHCSLNQVSWGNLSVNKVTEPVFNVTELASQTASITSNYIVSTGTGDDKSFFYVEEYYRLRYTTDRIYLLDYSRNMNSILNERDDIYVNDKIMIGVEEENLPLIESDDGNVFAFEVQNRLYSYNVTTNKLAVIFGFYDADNRDARTIYNQHSIQILNIDEGGNVHFAVYGYMNRGRHEGEVGILVYNYDSSLNTIEELLYIPYDKTYQILKSEMEQLFYLSRENYLYISLENSVYEINLTEKSCRSIIGVTQDESIQVSDNNRMLVWQSGGNLYEAEKLVMMDLSSREELNIEAKEGEYLMPLGFMGEDLVYGMARKEDIVVDYAGRTTFPMYAVYICNEKGEILKSYRQDGIYVSGCIMQNNQISLERLIKQEDGSYFETTPDYIMNSSEVALGKNTIKAVATENYGEFIQIAVKKSIDAKSLQILTPKEVLYEGGRSLTLSEENPTENYYVYGLGGVIGIYRSPAKAIMLAEQESGVVMNDRGDYVWTRGNRSTRNQIMAIEAESVTEEKNSLSVCLETMLKYEGIIRNTSDMLAEGQTVYEILTNNLENVHILDLKGCSLNAVLYYVDRDIPVLALQNDGSAVLVIGFNQYNVVLMNPETGKTYKMGMNDASELFEENGNSFITYIK